MNLFQIITVAGLASLLALELLQALRGVNHWRARLIRCGLSAAAAVAILQPDACTWVARRVGIQRGADLVSYLSVLALLAVAFYGYASYTRLQRQVTELARRLAILGATRGRDHQSEEIPQRAEEALR